MIELFSSLDDAMALKAGSQAKSLAYRKDQPA
jgi:hypothetical protein